MRNLLLLALLIPFVTHAQIRPIGVASIGTASIGISLVVIGATSRNPARLQGETQSQFSNRLHVTNARSKRLVRSGVALAILSGVIGITAHVTKDKRLSVDIALTSAKLRYTFARSNLK